MKFRWLVATALYAVACVAALFAAWPEDFEPSDPDVRSDGALLRCMIAGGDWLDAFRFCWMIPVLAATAGLWVSARKGVRPAHAELSAALALGALAYPFVSLTEPGTLPRFIHSSAAAFVLVFAAVLARRALARRHPVPARGTASLF